MQHCAYMLMVRPGTYLYHFGRLFQQFLVDNYVRIESARLKYVADNQQDFRCEVYSGLQDHADPCSLGRRIMLPSSFTGGPRYMKQMLQDGISIIRQRGTPSLFITFTCNPGWREITSQLPVGEKAQDRPDITVRVFHLKVQDLLHHIEESRCFGRVTGYAATIEFQKRGLPPSFAFDFDSTP